MLNGSCVHRGIFRTKSNICNGAFSLLLNHILKTYLKKLTTVTTVQVENSEIAETTEITEKVVKQSNCIVYH